MLKLKLFPQNRQYSFVKFKFIFHQFLTNFQLLSRQFLLHLIVL